MALRPKILLGQVAGSGLPWILSILHGGSLLIVVCDLEPNGEGVPFCFLTATCAHYRNFLTVFVPRLVLS
jgi:hypothetical protein